jgi:hypothetical protein
LCPRSLVPNIMKSKNLLKITTCLLWKLRNVCFLLLAQPCSTKILSLLNLCDIISKLIMHLEHGCALCEIREFHCRNTGKSRYLKLDMSNTLDVSNWVDSTNCIYYIISDISNMVISNSPIISNNLAPSCLCWIHTNFPVCWTRVIPKSLCPSSALASQLCGPSSIPVISSGCMWEGMVGRPLGHVGFLRVLMFPPTVLTP